MYILIADSGSTKTQWALVRSADDINQIYTQGINPYFTDTTAIVELLESELLPELNGEMPDQVFYYGTGCSVPEKREVVKLALEQLFMERPLIEVEHDMLGAARGLCQREPGIAAILGTGSNACRYNGKQVDQLLFSLGFMLGDEGSGAHLGKQLLTDFMQDNLPADLEGSLKGYTHLSPADMIDHLYKRPYPSRFLAGFARFISENRKHPYLQSLMRQSFQLFIDKQIQRIEGYNRLPIHFTGSIAWNFREEVEEIMKQNSLTLGQILQTPMDGLLEFHLADLG